MQQLLEPKAENANKGYYFDVTELEIQAHLKRSTKDIFEWLESTNKFVYALQTATERQLSKEVKTVSNEISNSPN